MKKIKDSNGFVISWGGKGRNLCFFVRYKGELKSTPLFPEDLAPFLIKFVKKIKK